jgi:hypothetical protein
MRSSRTNLLAMLVALAAICAAIGIARLGNARAGAIAAREDLIQCRADLAALTSAGGAKSVATSTPNESQLDRLLNESANEAGTKLASVEPGPADRTSAGNFVETSVFLRLDQLTLRQLVTFLQTLSQRDPAARAKLIELSAPQGPENAAPDAWAADLTIGYRSAAPARAK